MFATAIDKRTANQLIEVFPVVLGHQPECTQHRRAKVVIVGKSVVRISSRLVAFVTSWAGRVIIPDELTQTPTTYKSITSV